MKVVIVTIIKGSFPFIDELADNLKSKGHEVELLDLLDMYNVEWIDGEKLTRFHIHNKFLKSAFDLRYLGTFLKIVYYKLFFDFKSLKADHYSFHYVLPMYSFLIKKVKKSSKSTSACIWGSDFYRVSDFKRYQLKPLFCHVDKIVLCNRTVIGHFKEFYSDIDTCKIINSGFGIGKLELLKSLYSEQSIESIKKELKIPDGKVIICIGYNGLRAQQHNLMINSIKSLPNSLKEKLFLLIPFGYGGDELYLQEISSKLNELNLPYYVFNKFLSDKELLNIRIISDIVVNAQITDAASASLQEHLYCQNIVLAGRWLPYDYFIDNGIKLWFFEKEKLTNSLEDIIVNYENYKKLVVNNPNMVYKLSSWNSRIDEWESIFENKI